MVQTAGPALERKADVASFLTALEPGSVFFVDEIHRLGRAVEETLYPAMEDGELPVVLGQGAGARTVTLPLPPFTLIGATTRAGLLTTPLRDRFGVSHRLEHYSPEHLGADHRPLGRHPRRRDRRRGRADDRRALARHAARRQPAAEAGARLRPGQGPRRDRRRGRRGGAGDARGRRRRPRPQRPRPARHGRDQVRRRPGRPLDPGGRDRRGADTIEDVLEPYLLQQGLLKRTPRGRVLTAAGLRAPRAAGARMAQEASSKSDSQ